MRLDYDDYWGPYSPLGVLEWHEHPPQAIPSLIGLGPKTRVCQLIFVRHPERGWFFEYDSDREPRQWLVSCAEAGWTDEWVRHWACGEETYFLAACFVPQSVAERVVADFVATKGPSPAVRWVEFESLWPRRDTLPRRR